MNTTKSSRPTVALVTGASTGIGFELARLLARDGHPLFLVARDAERLQSSASQIRSESPRAIDFLALDLSRADAAANLHREIENRGLEISHLVNNAGFGVYGPFSQTDLDSELQMMQLNMVTLTELTKRLLPPMLARGHGWILNVASTAAFQPGPLMAVYYATKAYVLSFSEALANELKGSGVTVTALCPGPTESGFQKRAAMEDSGLVKGKKLMDSSTAARVGYQALLDGKTVVVPGLTNKLLAASTRFTPRSWVTAIVRKMQEKK